MENSCFSFKPILCISFLVGQWIFFLIIMFCCWQFFFCIFDFKFDFGYCNGIYIEFNSENKKIYWQPLRCINISFTLFFYIQKRKSFHACKACMHESIQMLLFTIIDLSFAYICVYVLLYIGKFDHQFTISYSFLSFIFFWIWNQQKTTTTTRAEIWMK